jgi:hypothetical protein
MQKRDGRHIATRVRRRRRVVNAGKKKLTYEAFFRECVMPPRPERPDELLWVLHQTGRMYEVVLRFYGKSHAWEARLLRNGSYLFGRPFRTRSGALKWATRERDRVAFVDLYWKDSYCYSCYTM